MISKLIYWPVVGNTRAGPHVTCFYLTPVYWIANYKHFTLRLLKAIRIKNKLNKL